MLPRPPTLVLATCMLAALAAIACSGLTGALALAEVFRTPKINQLYFLAAFSLVAIVAGGFGVVVARGRFRTGPALAMLCVSGPLIVAAMLGEPALSARLLRQPVEPMVISSVPIKYPALGILGGGLVFMLGSALTVFARNPARSYALLLRAALAFIPAGAIAFAIQKAPSLMPGLKTSVRITASVLAFFVVVALVSYGFDRLIRAFEAGRSAPDADPAGPSPAPTT